MNTATMITISIIITLLILAMIHMVKMKKRNFCSGNCSGCAVRCEKEKI